MSEPQLRRYRPEEIARSAEQGAAGEEARLFRTDEGTWWALEPDGEWKRYDGTSWQAGQRPTSTLEGIATPRSGEASPAEQATTIDEVKSAVAAVRAKYGEGALTSTEADERLGALTIKDEKEREWAYGATSGAWFAFDGTKWLDMPLEPAMAGNATRVPPPEPVAPEWDPPPAPGAHRPVVIEQESTTFSLAPEEPVPAATVSAPARPAAEPPKQAAPSPPAREKAKAEAPPPPPPPPPEPEPPAEIRRYDENDVLKIESVVAASSKAETRFFREDEGRWWALSDRGRTWRRYDGTAWTIGRAPRTVLTGPAVDPILGKKTEVSDWTPPPPPGATPPLPRATVEPQLIAAVQALSEEEQAAAKPKPKREIERSPGGIRRSGPGLAVLLGGIGLIAAAFLQWAHGSLGDQTGFDVTFRYLMKGGLDVTGSGFTVGVLVVIIGSLAVVLSLVRGTELFTRALGALGLATASLYLAQIARTVNTIRGSRIGGEEITDLLSYAPLLVIVASLMVLLGKPGAPKL